MGPGAQFFITELDDIAKSSGGYRADGKDGGGERRKIGKEKSEERLKEGFARKDRA